MLFILTKKILFISKQRIALYAGELVQTAQLSAYKHDDNNDKVNWLYYDSYISFGDVIYYGRINIKITGDNLSFYEINKIKEVETSTGSNGQRVSKPH